MSDVDKLASFFAGPYNVRSDLHPTLWATVGGLLSHTPRRRLRQRRDASLMLTVEGPRCACVHVSDHDDSMFQIALNHETYFMKEYIQWKNNKYQSGVQANAQEETLAYICCSTAAAVETAARARARPGGTAPSAGLRCAYERRRRTPQCAGS